MASLHTPINDRCWREWGDVPRRGVLVHGEYSRGMRVMEDVLAARSVACLVPGLGGRAHPVATGMTLLLIDVRTISVASARRCRRDSEYELGLSATSLDRYAIAKKRFFSLDRHF